MLFKMPTIEDVPEEKREEVEKNPALLKTFQRSIALEYTEMLLKKMTGLLKDYIREKNNPDKRNMIAEFINGYKKEAEEVYKAIDELKREES